MKFLIFFSLTFFVIFSSSAQVTVNVQWTQKTKLNAKEVIYYNTNKKLEWKDFLGTPPPPSSVAAVTSSGFGYSANMKSTNGKGEINIAVYCFFTKQKSWVRVKNKTAYILEHEQHHFDASYLAALGFIQKVKAANITTENMNDILSKLYKSSATLMQSLQNNYDSETNNGLNKEKQAEWNKYFNTMLITFPESWSGIHCNLED
jgi:hypothetical protein